MITLHETWVCMPAGRRGRVWDFFRSHCHPVFTCREIHRITPGVGGWQDSQSLWGAVIVQRFLLEPVEHDAAQVRVVFVLSKNQAECPAQVLPQSLKVFSDSSCLYPLPMLPPLAHSAIGGREGSMAYSHSVPPSPPFPVSHPPCRLGRPARSISDLEIKSSFSVAPDARIPQVFRRAAGARRLRAAWLRAFFHYHSPKYGSPTGFDRQPPSS